MFKDSSKLAGISFCAWVIQLLVVGISMVAVETLSANETLQLIAVGISLVGVVVAILALVQAIKNKKSVVFPVVALLLNLFFGVFLMFILGFLGFALAGM